MAKHLGSFVLVLLALGVVFGVGCGDDDAAVVYPTPSGSPEQLVGSALPDVAGENLTGQGGAKLSDFGGAPRVVVFWLNDCPHCQSELPALQSVASRLSNVKFASVAIDAKGSNGNGSKGYETPRAFVKSTKLTMPTLLVPRLNADAKFNLVQIPTVFLVDSGGTIVKTFTWPFATADVESSASSLK
ncbi:MAG: TlpA disulfide reductase family protein [Tepidiformaceae bacterium]